MLKIGVMAYNPDAGLPLFKRSIRAYGEPMSPHA